MSGSQDELPIVHLYAQSQWHMPAKIMGNRMGLTQLRDALDHAIKLGVVEITVMASDGEGYPITVQKASDRQLDNAPSHYTADYANHAPTPTQGHDPSLEEEGEG